MTLAIEAKRISAEKPAEVVSDWMIENPFQSLVYLIDPSGAVWFSAEPMVPKSLHQVNSAIPGPLQRIKSEGAFGLGLIHFLRNGVVSLSNEANAAGEILRFESGKEEAVATKKFPGCGFRESSLSPDEKVVYAAETDTGKLWAWDINPDGTVADPPVGYLGRHVFTYPGHVFFDSLAVEEDGRVCVATILNGGVTAITPQGAFEHHAFPDLIVTNICFGGADMRDAWVTLSSTGKLVKARWPRPGLKLNFGKY